MNKALGEGFPMNREKIEQQRNFSQLLWINAAFLILVLAANIVQDRPLFLVAHSVLLTLIIGLIFARKQIGTTRGIRVYLVSLMLYFASFTLIGEARSVDILWLTLFPPLAAFLIDRTRELRWWHSGFLALIGSIFALQWLGVWPSPYEHFTLGSVFTAVIFISLTSQLVQGYKERYLDSQRQFNELLKTRVDEGLNTIRELNLELARTQTDLVLLLGELCEARSEETGQHVLRVARYSAKLAQLAGLPQAQITAIEQAAPLHDVGKIAIPDAILNKPGKLTDEERALMQTHAQLGFELLSQSDRPLLQTAAKIALEHHEWWNGQGYPQQKQGRDISIEGRILAIADVFDALSFARVYKPAWLDEDIYNHFNRFSGVQFDPELTALLLENFTEFTELRHKQN
jgi:HD-GYP domain-containing protein (c-di-GMP phosphodiesterase class II)